MDKTVKTCLIISLILIILLVILEIVDICNLMSRFPQVTVSILAITLLLLNLVSVSTAWLKLSRLDSVNKPPFIPAAEVPPGGSRHNN